MAESEATFRIELDDKSGDAGSGGGAPSASDQDLIDQITMIRRMAADLQATDPKKSQSAVEDLLKKAVAAAIGDAASKLSGEALVGVSKELTDALIKGMPASDVLALARRLTQTVGPATAGGVGGGQPPVPPTPGGPSGAEPQPPGRGPPPVPPPSTTMVPYSYPVDFPNVIPPGRFPVSPDPALNAAEALRKQEEEARKKKRDRQAAHEAYRDMYGETSEQETAEKSAGRQATVGRVAQLGQVAAGLGVPGGGAAGNVASGAARGGMAGETVGAMLGLEGGALAAAGPVGMIAGAVISAVQEVLKTLQEGLAAQFRVATLIVNMDPWELARGFSTMLEKIPLVGSLLGSVAGGLLGLLDAVETTAKRLSQYNADLAYQLVQFDLRRMERDMRRAQENAPQIMAAQEARFQLENKLNDIIDKLLPLMLRIATFLADIVNLHIELPGKVIGGMTEFWTSQPIIGPMFQNVVDEIRRNTRRDEAIPDGNMFVRELLEMTRPLGGEET